MKKDLLSIENLRKTFPGRGKSDASTVTALDGVSFSVQAGEFVCILGKSGCGKSTLLGVLAGLSQADSGKAFLDGTPICGPDKRRMLMFQEPNLFPWLNVLENVLYGLKLDKSLDKNEQRRQAEKYLDLVGLSGFMGFRVHELSGGMKQRVALARALAPSPEILLMDEPFSALDAMTREQLYADMQAVWKTTGKTVIMVTHNAREASCLGTRVILMNRGSIVDDLPVNMPFPRTMNDLSVTENAAFITERLQAATLERENA